MQRIQTIERVRQERQAELDEQKTQGERNRLGQFATPEPLALEMLSLAHALWKPSTKLRFFDPAIGIGSFYSALRRTFPARLIESAAGVELDDAFVRTARELWGQWGLEIQGADFTRLNPPPVGQRATLLVANPPYVRHHHLKGADKLRLRSAVASHLSLKISGLAGLYCYFLLLSHHWMEESGLAVWLIPSEFLDVNYGVTLRQYLREQVTLVRLHRFDPTEVQFTDALVSSAVIVFRKSPPDAGHRVQFTFGGSLAKPRRRQEISLAKIPSSAKWSVYPQPRGASRVKADGPHLSEFFAITRGIATGANDFFILPRNRARELEIPSEHVRPILPSPRHLHETVIEADQDGYPVLPEQLVVIDCALPEAMLSAAAPGLAAYLQTAKAGGILDRYLVRKRGLWYRQEQRPPAPFLSTYMGRGTGVAKPFRFIWNKSDAIAANVYLLLYPVRSMKLALAQAPSLYAMIFKLLQDIDADALRAGGRVYGGALHKLEPKELGGLSAAPFAEAIAPYLPREQTLFGAAAQVRPRTRIRQAQP